MKLNHDIIASIDSQGKDRPCLTLIHGWGADNSTWHEWAKHSFSHRFTLHLIELPGFGKSPQILAKNNIAELWLDAVYDSLPETTHLLGWSLGGILSQKLTLNYPKKIKSLICIASTPRFTQLDGWSHAVSPRLLSDFLKAVGVEYTATLKKFWSLQLQGSKNARPLLKKLIAHATRRRRPKISGLVQGLSLLRDLDNRQNLHTITQPTLWLLGEFDPLIPQALVEDLSKLQPKATVIIIKDASHMLFFSHPEETAEHILNFLETFV